jgi:predicted nucleotidyltransferase/HEPN domain-containing protein
MVDIPAPMKTSLDHLPAHKRELIIAIAKLLQESAPVEMLILFGSYARGDWVEDPVSGYVSDVDLMVVVATEDEARKDPLWADLERRARALAGRVPVTLLVHAIKQVNQEIRSGQYFFADVVSEGVLLFDSRHVQLAHPKALGPRERLELAERNFRYWFESAGEFYRGAGYYAGRGLRSHAAFLLHQAAERYFHAALLVFTGYKPKTHDIELLANQTAPLHSAMQGALPREAPEDERLFKLLKRAYIEARYSKSYRVTAEEFAILAPRVLDLGARVRAACSEKLATFCGPEAVSALPEEPKEANVGELPEAPPLGEPEAFEAWREALVALSFERGEARGLKEGEARGEARGVERGLKEGEARAKAIAILDVLRRRGIEISDADAQRILACREESALALYWERAFSAASATDLLGE